MNTQRRETDREAAESVERIWQIYADEIGLPKSGPAERAESPPRQDGPLTPRRRHRVVAVVAVVVVALGGIALWPKSSRSPDTAAQRPSTPASAPAGEADRIARPPSPVPPPSAAAGPDTSRASGALSAEVKPAGAGLTHRIGFGFGSDAISEESRRILDKIVAAMKADPGWRVAIEGHTDALGTPDYNQALSERRAETVKSYLQSAGIVPARLSATGFGASRPVAPNDAVGHALNRRVDFHRQ